MSIDVDLLQKEINQILSLESSYQKFENNQASRDRAASIVASWLQKYDLPIDMDIIKKHISFDGLIQ